MRRFRWTAIVVLGALFLSTLTVSFAVVRLVVDGGLRVRSTTTVPSLFADQGSATITTVHGTALITRGHGSIPSALYDAGWTHVGDPSGAGTAIVDAYQSATRAAKLFTITTADGTVHRYLHRLVAGESYHNSFAAVSPDGRWLVSGEWGTERRLLLFAMPTASPPGVHRLSLAGTIALSRPVRDVQGCAFTSDAALLCATNDPGTDLFPVPRQLLTVMLRARLRPGTNPAAPTLIASAPAVAHCALSPGEVEGVDVAGAAVRVSVNSPCANQTHIFSLTPPTDRDKALDIDNHLAWAAGAWRPAEALAASRAAHRTSRAALT